MNEPVPIVSVWTHEASAKAAAIRNSFATAEASEAVGSTSRWECAEGIAELLDSGLSTREVADKIGKSQSVVTRYARCWRSQGESKDSVTFQAAMAAVRETAAVAPVSKPTGLDLDIREVIRQANGGSHTTLWTVSFGPAKFYVSGGPTYRDKNGNIVTPPSRLVAGDQLRRSQPLGDLAYASGPQGVGGRVLSGRPAGPRGSDHREVISVRPGDATGIGPGWPEFSGFAS